MFWLSYESFSFLCDVFYRNRVISISTPWLFKSFEFGNGSRISDEKLVLLEFKYLQNKNGRNKQ